MVISSLGIADLMRAPGARIGVHARLREDTRLSCYSRVPTALKFSGASGLASSTLGPGICHGGFQLQPLPGGDGSEHLAGLRPRPHPAPMSEAFCAGSAAGVSIAWRKREEVASDMLREQNRVEHIAIAVGSYPIPGLLLVHPPGRERLRYCLPLHITERPEGLWSLRQPLTRFCTRLPQSCGSLGIRLGLHLFAQSGIGVLWRRQRHGLETFRSYRRCR